jgi:hypothetical protein
MLVLFAPTTDIPPSGHEERCGYTRKGPTKRPDPVSRIVSSGHAYPCGQGEQEARDLSVLLLDGMDPAGQESVQTCLPSDWNDTSYPSPSTSGGVLSRTDAVDPRHALKGVQGDAHDDDDTSVLEPVG